MYVLLRVLKNIGKTFHEQINHILPSVKLFCDINYYIFMIFNQFLMLKHHNELFNTPIPYFNVYREYR